MTSLVAFSRHVVQGPGASAGNKGQGGSSQLGICFCGKRGCFMFSLTKRTKRTVMLSSKNAFSWTDCLLRMAGLFKVLLGSSQIFWHRMQIQKKGVPIRNIFKYTVFFPVFFFQLDDCSSNVFSPKGTLNVSSNFMQRTQGSHKVLLAWYFKSLNKYQVFLGSPRRIIYLGALL